MCWIGTAQLIVGTLWASIITEKLRDITKELHESKLIQTESNIIQKHQATRV